MVGHKEGIELAVFQLLRETFEMVKIEIRIREGARITPRGGMDTNRPHESPKPQLTRTGHSCLPPDFTRYGPCQATAESSMSANQRQAAATASIAPITRRRFCSGSGWNDV